MADATYPKCHIYSQDSWHGEAYIVGNRAGLEKLLKCNIREGQY